MHKLQIDVMALPETQSRGPNRFICKFKNTGDASVDPLNALGPPATRPMLGCTNQVEYVY
eukprot:12401326-Ditylum_brightwellii.AAC.1